MQCFKCTNKFTDPKTYFRHIQEQHELRGKGRYICTLCAEVLNEFGKYKKHVEICFLKNPIENDLERDEFLEAFNDCEMEDVDITIFKDTAKKSALKIASKMNANMNTPRCLTYEMISEFQTHIDTIVDGIIFYFILSVALSYRYFEKDFLEQKLFVLLLICIQTIHGNAQT